MGLSLDNLKGLLRRLALIQKHSGNSWTQHPLHNRHRIIVDRSIANLRPYVDKGVPRDSECPQRLSMVKLLHCWKFLISTKRFKARGLVHDVFQKRALQTTTVHSFPCPRRYGRDAQALAVEEGFTRDCSRDGFVRFLDKRTFDLPCFPN